MLEAFADYQLDMSYMTAERSWLRNRKSGVQYDCSVGAYDGDRIVGVTCVGLDDWQGEWAAFDSGTGIIPQFRGQGVAKGMFDFVLPRLRERGVTRFLLEVLQPNEAAIRAYTKAGFRITREFACYTLLTESFTPAKSSGVNFDVRVIDKADVQSYKTLVDWHPSWENSFSGMDRIGDTLIRLGAFHEDRLVGVLVYYPLLNWLMSLVVDGAYRRQGIASRLLESLLERIPKELDKIKITNVDRSDGAMLSFFEKSGAAWEIDQYEMDLSIGR